MLPLRAPDVVTLHTSNPPALLRARRLARASGVAATAAALLGASSIAGAQETFTPAFGGSGGQQFIARCPANTQVTGVQARTGAYVNYIAPLCNGRPIPGGGGAGERRSAVCPAGSVVRSMAVTSLRSPNHLLKALVLDCAARGSQTRTASVPLDTPGAFTSPTGPIGNIALFVSGPVGALRMMDNVNTHYPKGTLSCNDKDIIGLQGRAGAAVDAVGLICR